LAAGKPQEKEEAGAMKRTLAIAFAGLAGWAAIAAGDARAQTAQAGKEQLLAPVYPGSVRYPSEALGYDFTYTAAFLSKDDLETVRAFYERELGPARKGGLTDFSYSQSESVDGYVYSWPIMSQSEVYEYVDFGESGRPGGRGSITTPVPESVDDPSRYPVVGPIFDRLQEIVRSGDAMRAVGMVGDQKSYSRADLDEVVERYGYLAWRNYLPVGDDIRQTTAWAIVERCKKENKPDKQALQARIQELTMQGKPEEATQLAMSMMGGGGAYFWDAWIECLDEIEQNAYRTWIAINEHPSVWKARIAAWEAAREQQ
jgi:hypothetical protein